MSDPEKSAAMRPDLPAPERLPPLLLTRPADRARGFLQRLEACLSPLPPVLIAPVMEILPRPLPEDLSRYRGLILTSAQAARLLAAPLSAPAFVVGEETARAARARGLDVHAVAETAEDLLALLRARPLAAPLIHLRGTETRLDLAAALSSAGTETHEAVVYEQRPIPLGEAARALLARPHAVVAPLFSPRSATLFAKAAEGARAALHLVAMSPAVADAWRAHWTGPEPERLAILPAPRAAEMVHHVAELYRNWPG